MTVEGIRITQQELAEVAELEREIAWKTKRVEDLKSNVRALLLAKIPIEPGRFDARLKKRFGRHIPWRQLVIEKLGLDVAEWFRKLYPVNIFFEVQVVEHAVPPLWKGKEKSWDTGE